MKGFSPVRITRLGSALMGQASLATSWQVGIGRRSAQPGPRGAIPPPHSLFLPPPPPSFSFPPPPCSRPPPLAPALLPPPLVPSAGSSVRARRHRARNRVRRCSNPHRRRRA